MNEQLKKEIESGDKIYKNFLKKFNFKYTIIRTPHTNTLAKLAFTTGDDRIILCIKELESNF